MNSISSYHIRLMTAGDLNEVMATVGKICSWTVNTISLSPNVEVVC